MEILMNVIKELQSTNGRLEKENILYKNRDNKLIKEVFEFVYNPFIVTGISKKKLNKKLDIKGLNITDLKDLMNYLKAHNTGRNIDIATVQQYLNSLKEEEREFVSLIVTKTLKIGCTSKTLNKVYEEDFIPSFNVMLAKKYWDEINKVKGNEFCITTKLDGGRLIGIKENNEVTFFTRQGQLIEGLKDIAKELIEFLPDNYVLDGELLLENKNKLPSKDLYRETMKESRKNGIKKNLIFNAFDLLPLEEFKKGKSSKNCFDRKEELHNLFNREYKWIKEVNILYKGKDTSKIEEFLNKAIDKDEEGIMINLNLPYECKRTSNILKVKKMQDCDLRVIGFEEGDGNLRGTLGRINVEFKDNIIGVGSGFDLLMREEVWNNKDKYINKIAKIQYFEVSTNQKDGKESLRFPVFKEWRFDKNEPSLY